MDKLWAPWRMKYLKNNNNKRKCVFCECSKSKKNDYVIFRTKHSIAMLNIFPYNNGHAMISPLKHTPDIEKLTDREILDLFRSLKLTKKLLTQVLKPHGFNVGVNISESAGAGIAGHLHIHIVPRWKGDTNFMPVIFDSKIISQSLEELLKRLKNAYAKTNREV